MAYCAIGFREVRAQPAAERHMSVTRGRGRTAFHAPIRIIRGSFESVGNLIWSTAASRFAWGLAPAKMKVYLNELYHQRSSRRKRSSCRVDESHQQLKLHIFLTHVVCCWLRLAMCVCVCVSVHLWPLADGGQPTVEGLMVPSEQLTGDGGGWNSPGGDGGLKHSRWGRHRDDGWIPLNRRLASSSSQLRQTGREKQTSKQQSRLSSVN